MFDNLDIFRMASGLARHASNRQETIARNIANADTPEYRAKDIESFSESVQTSKFDNEMRSTRVGHLVHEAAFSMRNREFDAPGASSPNGNTVSLETEMMKAVEARHQHEMALSVYKSSMNIIRGSIGRR